MAILESDGWKYFAEFVKAFAPNAAGQSINEDPTLTTLEIDNTPLRCNIPGLTAASGNQIPLPQDLEYMIRAWTILTSASTNQFMVIPILWNATDSNKFTSGSDILNTLGGVDNIINVSTQIEKLSAAKNLEFKVLKKGYSGAASDVTVARNFSGGTALAFSNSTAGLDIRTKIQIWAK